VSSACNITFCITHFVFCSYFNYSVSIHKHTTDMCFRALTDSEWQHCTRTGNVLRAIQENEGRTASRPICAEIQACSCSRHHVRWSASECHIIGTLLHSIVRCLRPEGHFLLMFMPSSKVYESVELSWTSSTYCFPIGIWKRFFDVCYPQYFIWTSLYMHLFFKKNLCLV